MVDPARVPVRSGRATAGPTLDLDVDLVEPLGEQVLVHGTVAGTAVQSGAEEEQAILIVAEVAGPDHGGLRRPRACPGDRVRLRVVPDRIYLFDLRPQRGGRSDDGDGPGS